MNSESHPDMVARLSKPGQSILNDLSPVKCHLLHMAVGISGESGEILDTVKKHCIYNKELDVENLVEELGDMEYFMEGLRAATGITREQTLAHNIEKLNRRYLAGYSNQAAQARADKA
jgi:NTP pyrophosphatase (non-canonical NTP hydrolase)